MSIQYCNYCDRKIDTDNDAEHFDSADDTECIQEEMDNLNWFDKGKNEVRKSL